jgi:hypothetical protein
MAWIKKDRGTLLRMGYTCCIFAIAYLALLFSRPKVHSENDLYFLNGEYQNYQFTDGTRGSHTYLIWLKNYSNPFQVDANFLDLFNKYEFEELPSDYPLTLSISKEDLNKLNNPNDNVRVFSIVYDNVKYLDTVDTIKEYNSILNYCYFFGLLVAGVLLVYFGYKSKIKTSIFSFK